jgi:hypothetical protein
MALRPQVLILWAYLNKSTKGRIELINERAI